MQPQNNASYDFILNDPQTPKRRLPLPNLPKLAWVILGSGLGILLLVVILALLTGGKATKSNDYITVLARAQEISRVSKLADGLSQDPQVQALAATTQASLNSDASQITSYLKKAGTKVKPTSLNIYLDKNVDTQLQSAAQANNLPSIYIRYLKTNLALYQNSLNNTYKSAKPAPKDILRSAYNSTDTILTSSLISKAI